MTGDWEDMSFDFRFDGVNDEETVNTWGDEVTDFSDETEHVPSKKPVVRSSEPAANMKLTSLFAKRKKTKTKTKKLSSTKTADLAGRALPKDSKGQAKQLKKPKTMKKTKAPEPVDPRVAELERKKQERNAEIKKKLDLDRQKKRDELFKIPDLQDDEEETAAAIKRQLKKLAKEEPVKKILTLDEIMAREAEKVCKPEVPTKTIRKPESRTGKWKAAPELNGAKGDAERVAAELEARKIRRELDIQERKRIAELMADRKSSDPAVKQRACQKLKGTKVCQHAYNPIKGIFQPHRCRRRGNCGFAHSKKQHLEALLGTLCSWDRGCNSCRKGNKCLWLHSVWDCATENYRNETADEYLARTGKILGELPHEIRERKKREAAAPTCAPCAAQPTTIPGLGKPVSRKVRPGMSYAKLAAVAPKTEPAKELQGSWTRVASSSTKKHLFKKRCELIHNRVLKPFVAEHVQKLAELIQAEKVSLALEKEMQAQADAAVIKTAVRKEATSETAESSVTDNTDDSLSELLTRFRMQDFEGKLKTLGVEVAADIAFVEAEDAEELGMSKIQMRKFLRMQQLVA